MLLNKKLATKIVSELHSIVNFNLNIMDETGLILASTDQSRINTYHKGSHIILQENLGELVVEEDNQYEGCKKGINLPIRFAESTIGVIGITGNPSDVIKYGQIIKKMTEMLVYENYETSRKELAEKAKLIFITHLINGTPEIFSVKPHDLLWQNFLKISGPYAVAILKYTQLSCGTDDVNTDYYQATHQTLKKHIIHQLSAQRVLATYADDFFIIVANQTAKELEKVIVRLADDFENRYSYTILCAIGNAYDDYSDIPKSYNEALAIFRYYEKSEKGIFPFNAIVLEFIICQVPFMHQKNLCNNVFRNLTDAEIVEFGNFIILYFQCNGSLKTLAEKCFIHKNTVQYKIQKILKATGFDMRTYRHLFVLYLASMYYFSMKTL